MTAPSSARAPAAPGAMGSAPEPAVLSAYLTELDGWVRARKAELDELDAGALAAGRGAEVAADMALSLALWKGVADRFAEMWATWDGGRVLEPQRQRIAALVWGRVEGAGVSVPEACKLSDALAGQLSARLTLTPGADAAAARVRTLRAQLERIRDQVGLEPPVGREVTVDKLANLMARLEGVAERAGRGADVSGMLPVLEQEAAVFERDLIVGNQRRRDARKHLAVARRRRAELEQRGAALTTLAATCVATVDPAPRYAVPDVEALGPVPNTAEAITAYLARLDRVGQAIDLAHDKYATALAEHSGLVLLLDTVVARARSAGLADRDDLAASERQAREVLARRPCPMTVARQLVATYQTWLTSLGPGKEPTP